jgi:hypothetical protein
MSGRLTESRCSRFTSAVTVKAGFEAGSHWARTSASVSQLENLRARCEPRSGIFIPELDDSNYMPEQDVFFAIYPADSGDSGASERFWLEVADSQNPSDPDFLEAFIRGALEVWKETSEVDYSGGFDRDRAPIAIHFSKPKAEHLLETLGNIEPVACPETVDELLALAGACLSVASERFPARLRDAGSAVDSARPLEVDKTTLAGDLLAAVGYYARLTKQVKEGTYDQCEPETEALVWADVDGINVSSISGYRDPALKSGKIRLGRDERDYDAGFKNGELWANNRASTEELGRLRALIEAPSFDWNQFLAEPADRPGYGPAERLFSVLRPRTASDHISCLNFWRSATADAFGKRPAFVRGFAEGASRVESTAYGKI